MSIGIRINREYSEVELIHQESNATATRLEQGRVQLVLCDAADVVLEPTERGQQRGRREAVRGIAQTLEPAIPLLENQQ